MSLEALLEHWQAEPTLWGNIVHQRVQQPRAARHADFPEDLHPALLKLLPARRIQALYCHQAESWKLARQRVHIALVTGTASGKTLAYNLPVLDAILRDPQTRALYLFPTKALARDQLTKLSELAEELEILRHPRPAIAAYDGDTPASQRRPIRRHVRLLLTNPDMLHTGILPRHTDWGEFFEHLRFVIIDEMHIYRGVFGSHVANVIRRLKRIARFYGAQPQFLLTSATIANPAELAERLVEEPISLITEDGSPQGRKLFLIYNPPITVPELGLRANILQESLRLGNDLLTYDVQTVLFGRSRRTVELLVHYLREQYRGSAEKIRGYRSGYLPEERRAIELELRTGAVRAVAATNALELGMDIGGLEAAVLVGYPGTIAATHQQAGRAGRGDQLALSVLVASASPLDQFLAHHPEYLFERTPEKALINPNNPLILLNHLQCAAFELPFREGEGFGRLSPEELGEILQWLAEKGLVHLSGGRYYWTSQNFPAGQISLRTASPQKIILQVPTDHRMKTIGEVDGESATWLVHPGAIYLHEGEQYLVDELNLEKHLAYLHPAAVDYYTEPRRETSVVLREQLAERTVAGARIAHGELEVSTQTTAFRKIQWFTHANLGLEPLNLPPSCMQTNGYWLVLSPETVDHLRQEGLWHSDPNTYGRNWNRQRDLARQRDHFTCQVCGIPERDQAHHVHHKTPFRAFASAEEANRLENLITLCPACHQKVENVVRIRSGLAGLAYALRHIAPLLLMCDAQDLGVHSDPQSPLGDGHSTVVIYENIPAGLGFSQQLYQSHSELIAAAYDLVCDCPCADGCPSCVGPGGEAGMGSKPATLALLTQLHCGKT